MAAILIEGATPNTYLTKGQRRYVERTELVDKLLRTGYVREVEPVPDEDAPEPADPVDVEAPPRNASRDVWRDFLLARGFAVSTSSGRDQLVAQWDARTDG